MGKKAKNRRIKREVVRLERRGHHVTTWEQHDATYSSVANVIMSVSQQGILLQDEELVSFCKDPKVVEAKAVELAQRLKGLAIRLKEIRDVLNFDLIPATFAQNKWDDTDYPTFEFGSLSSPDMEAVSKYLQRTAATGSIEIDRELLNYSRSILGLDPKPDDEPPNTPTATSRGRILVQIIS